MADEKKQDKKKDDGINPYIIKSPTHINIDGSVGTAHMFADTGYKNTLNITGRAHDLGAGATLLNNDYAGGRIYTGPTVDVGIHGAMYAGTQPLAFAEILGATSVLGKNLVEMKINTIGDARNFMVGVNNVASVFSANRELLKSIESASAIVLTNGRLITEAMDRINTPSVTSVLRLATEYQTKANEIIKLSESVTTVLAYGQAVQNQFSILTNSEIFKNGATVLRDSSITLGKISDHIPIYFNSEAITSPFVYAPQRVKTKEVEKALPEVKKDLPVKTTEAIEMIEYFRNPDTKKGDAKVLTTLNEIKRAIENVVGFSTMVIQQTTIKQLVIGKNNEPLFEDLVVGPLVYRKDGAILYKQTPIKMRSQMKTLCIIFMNNHKNLVDYSTIKDELVPAKKRSTTSFKTITKYVSELHKLLQNHFKREVIFNQEKDGYIFDIERDS